jgi:hypothetical protein
VNTKEMAEALLAALDTVDGVKAYRVGDNITPPGAVLGPPALEFEGYCVDPLLPSSATFMVWAVVAADSWSMDRLWELVPQLAAAVETVPDAGVTRADPAVFSAGDLELPAYTLTVPVTLS